MTSPTFSKLETIALRLRMRVPRNLLSKIDAEEIANFALWKATIRLGWDEATARSNVALVHKIARDLLRDAIRDERRLKRGGGKDLVFLDADSSYTVSDPRSEIAFSEIEAMDSSMRLIVALNELEKLVLELRRDGHSDTEIGTIICKNYTEVKSIRKHIRDVSVELGFRLQDSKTPRLQDSKTPSSNVGTD